LPQSSTAEVASAAAAAAAAVTHAAPNTQGSAGLQQVCVRFASSPSNRDCEWLQDTVDCIPIPLLKTVFVSFTSAAFFCTLAMVSDLYLYSVVQSQMYTSASSLGLSSSASENFKPHIMSLVSPRLYWALLQAVGPPVDTALQRLLPDLDWNFVRARQRRASAKGVASADSEHQWKQLRATGRREQQRQADIWSDVATFAQPGCIAASVCVSRPSDACVALLRRWADRSGNDWDAVLDSRPCPHCRQHAETHSERTISANVPLPSSAILQHVQSCAAGLCRMIGVAPAGALLACWRAGADQATSPQGDVERTTVAVRSELFGLAALPLAGLPPPREGGSQPMELPEAIATLLAMRQHLQQHPCMPMIIACVNRFVSLRHECPDRPATAATADENCPSCGASQGAQNVISSALDLLQSMPTDPPESVSIPVVIISILRAIFDVAASWQLGVRAFLKQHALSDVVRGLATHRAHEATAVAVNAKVLVQDLCKLGIVSLVDFLQFDAALLSAELIECGAHVRCSGGEECAPIREQDVQSWLDSSKCMVGLYSWLEG